MLARRCLSVLPRYSNNSLGKNLAESFSLNRVIAVVGLVLGGMACTQEPPVDPTLPSVNFIAPTPQTAPSTYDAPINVTVNVENISQYWMTTDGTTPQKLSSCAHTTDETVLIDATAKIQILFEYEGVDTIADSGTYFINGSVQTSDWTNEEVRAEWENMYIHIGEVTKAQYGANLSNGTYSINDGQGGTVVNYFSDVQKFLGTVLVSRNRMVLSNYHYGNLTVVSGVVETYGNYYSTSGHIISLTSHLTDPNEGGVAKQTNVDNYTETDRGLLLFAGPYYNGSVKGKFYLGNKGNGVYGPTAGDYVIDCSDNGCSETPVTYSYQLSTESFIESGGTASPTGTFLSCTP